MPYSSHETNWKSTIDSVRHATCDNWLLRSFSARAQSLQFYRERNSIQSDFKSCCGRMWMYVRCTYVAKCGCGKNLHAFVCCLRSALYVFGITFGIRFALHSFSCSNHARIPPILSTAMAPYRSLIIFQSSPNHFAWAGRFHINMRAHLLLLLLLAMFARKFNLFASALQIRFHSKCESQLVVWHRREKCANVKWASTKLINTFHVFALQRRDNRYFFDTIFISIFHVPGTKR